MNSRGSYDTYAIPMTVEGLQFFETNQPFELEAGGKLENLTIAYNTYGLLNENRDNVIWVCHALTANSDLKDWWRDLYGEKKLFDPKKYFIVCANILGSCYGSTGARSCDPKSGKKYGMQFPLVTIRDQIQAHFLLMKHLDISSIDLCIGGSCGGHQAMEMAYILKDRIKKLVLLVTSARETAWVIAGHAAQRKAIEADPTLYEDSDWAGRNGLMGARAMALLHYRTFESYVQKQTSPEGTLDQFAASSYVGYQGEKLAKRFYAQCYYQLTRTLDTHDIGRGRGGAAIALAEITCPTLVIGIHSDQLIPPSEQKFLAKQIPAASYHEIQSAFGHDGFLVETEKVEEIVSSWLKSFACKAK